MTSRPFETMPLALLIALSHSACSSSDEQTDGNLAGSAGAAASTGAQSSESSAGSGGSSGATSEASGQSGAGSANGGATGGGGATTADAGGGGDVPTAGNGGSTSGGGGSGEGTGGANEGGTPNAGSGGGSAANGGGNSTSADPVPEATTTCSFTVDSSISERIATVGIVTWSTDLQNLDSARIDFGLDANYGMKAPVDLSETNLRTLLLGMKPDHEYHFKISATAGDETCATEDMTLVTGPAPNALPYPETVTTELPEQVADGYILTSKWGTPGGPAFIMDKDRDFVWWFMIHDEEDGAIDASIDELTNGNGMMAGGGMQGGMAGPGGNPLQSDDIMRIRFSYDNKYLWFRNTAQGDGTGYVARITPDGLDQRRWDLGTTTHDLAVIPDGHLALIAHATENTCDEILEFDPETETVTQLFNLTDAHGALDCHVNAITYVAGDDTFVFSDWAESVYVKISRTGELLWVLNGGDNSDFSGTSWEKQHGLHMLTPNHMVMFSNGANNGTSIVYEYLLDPEQGTAEELWSYDAGLSTQFGGDVQRLPNGNTLISYSVSGVMQEVNKEGALVQELEWGSGDTIAYHVHRKSLYGAPPRIHDFVAD